MRMNLPLQGRDCLETICLLIVCAIQPMAVILAAPSYITNSYHVHVGEEIDAFAKLSFEAQFQALSPGGAISYVEVPNMHQQAVDDGDSSKLGTADAGDNRERGVGRGGSTDANGGQRTKEAKEQGGKQEGGELAQHVIHQSQGAEFYIAHLGDEHAGEGIVAEAGAHGKPVGHTTTLQQQGHKQGAHPGAKDGDEGHEHEALVDVA